jgi:hypothetical protein
MEMTNEELQKLLTSFEQEVSHIKEWQIDRNNNLRAVNTTETQSNGGKIGGKISGQIAKEKKLGFHSMDKEHRSKVSKEVGDIIGPRSYKEGFGIFGLSDEEKLKVAKYAAEQSINSPNHNSKKTLTCPHCDKEGTYLIMRRWHMDKCKHRPI